MDNEMSQEMDQPSSSYPPPLFLGVPLYTYPRNASTSNTVFCCPNICLDDVPKAPSSIKVHLETIASKLSTNNPQSPTIIADFLSFHGILDLERLPRNYPWIFKIEAFDYNGIWQWNRYFFRDTTPSDPDKRLFVEITLEETIAYVKKEFMVDEWRQGAFHCESMEKQGHWEKKFAVLFLRKRENASGDLQRMQGAGSCAETWPRIPWSHRTPHNPLGF